ncbi:MAG: hypothetical protein GYA18_09545 [Chloroflexi bacterium]|nr:hypothetical protein [Chloroflexota bacterium]
MIACFSINDRAVPARQVADGIRPMHTRCVEIGAGAAARPRDSITMFRAGGVGVLYPKKGRSDPPTAHKADGCLRSGAATFSLQDLRVG